MRAIVVRHYRTIHNRERRIMGWGDAPPAADWEEDMIAVDQSLRRHVDRIDAFYASALERSRATATHFAKHRGKHAIHCSARLNEVNYGDLRHKPKRWVTEHYPAYKTDADFIFPNGESFRQMQRRSVEFLLSLQRIHANHTLLLVLHAGVIRGLICHFVGLDLTANLKRKVSHKYVGEFVIAQDRCLSYNELGQASGFVKNGVLAVPLQIDSIPPVDLGDAKAETQPTDRPRKRPLGNHAPYVMRTEPKST